MFIPYSDPHLDRKGTYPSEEIIGMFAQTRKLPSKYNKLVEEVGEWIVIKSKSTAKRKRAATAPRVGSRKRKFLSQKPKKTCACGERGHNKEECLYVCCRYCKKLGHVIAECLAVPNHLRRNKEHVYMELNMKAKNKSPTVLKSERVIGGC